MNDSYREAITQLISHYLNVTYVAEYPMLLVSDEENQILTQCYYATCFLDASDNEDETKTLSIFHNHGAGGCVKPDLDSGLYRFQLDIDVANRLSKIKRGRDFSSELEKFISSTHYTLPVAVNSHENGSITLTPTDKNNGYNIPHLSLACSEDGEGIRLLARMEGEEPLTIPLGSLDAGSLMIKHALLSGNSKLEIFTHLKEISELAELSKSPAYFGDVHFTMLEAKLASEKAKQYGVFKCPYEFAGGYSSEPRDELTGLLKCLQIFDKDKVAEPEEVVENELDDDSHRELRM